MPQARAAAKRIRDELDSLLTQELGKYASEDTSLVVFGSLARGEWTSGSDLDWTYLIDGQANSDHLRIAQKINRLVRKRFIGPGATGTFGNLAFSHELIHQIGGQNDTNKNTTQRILLLLESAPIGNRIQAYDRVILGVINRYLEEHTFVVSRLEPLPGPTISSKRHRPLLENNGRRFRQQAEGPRRNWLGSSKCQASNVPEVDLCLRSACLFQRTPGP